VISGIVSLQPIYELLQSHPKPQLLLKLAGPNAPGKVFTQKCAELVSAVPGTQGFYLWGFYERNGLWRNVYLGKAGLGPGASLKKRILEELKDERCFAMRPFLAEKAIMQEGRRIHLGMWATYNKHWERALRKQNTTYIAWVSTPALSNEDILRIEADLIESLNPTANLNRPSPPATLQGDTKEIFALIRQSIHTQRATAYRL
jgi:hypothetical protein